MIKTISHPSLKSHALVNPEATRTELARDPHRAVIFGSFLEGATGVAFLLRECYEDAGVGTPVITAERHTTGIDRAFFGIGAGMGHENTLPGLVVFQPQMQQSAEGAMVPTPHRTIEARCQQFGVPVLGMTVDMPMQDLESSLRALTHTPHAA